MAHNIQVVLSADDLSAVDLSNQDHFTFRVRSGEKIAERIDNTASSARDHRIRSFAINGIVIIRKIMPPIELVGGKHKATPFDGDVPHRGYPGVPAIGSGGAINLDALRVHCRSHQRQIVLPTDNCAYLTEWRFEDWHGGTISETPYQTLRSSRHDLPMIAEKTAIRGKE